MEKVIRIVSKKDRHTDREYWLSKTPQERLDALEELRMQYTSVIFIPMLYPDFREFIELLKKKRPVAI